MKNLIKIAGIFILVLYLASTSSCQYKLPGDKVVVDTTDVNKPISKIIKTDTTSEEICITEKIKWKPGSDETFTIDPQSDVIYEGAVIEASSLQNGKFTPITGGKRKPINISISIPSFDTVSTKIEVPSLSTIREAKKRILKSKQQGMQPAQFSVDCYEVFSKDHLNLIFKSKYSSGFGKIEGGYNFDDTTVRSRYVLDLTQVYYSMDVDAPGREGFYSKKPDNVGEFSPAYISSMKYGRKVLIFIESKENIQNKAFNLKAEFTLFAGSGELSANSLTAKLLNENSIKILAIGGNPENPYYLFKALADKKTLHDILIKDAIWSLKNQGVPLAYTVRHCSNGSIFTLTQYGEFVARKCEMKSSNEMTINPPNLNNLCPDHIGGDREFDGKGPRTSFRIKIFNIENDIVANVFCDWIETESDYTHGVFNKNIVIAHIPDNLQILEITSSKETSWDYTDNNGHTSEGNTFQDSMSPIKSISIMGDTGDDDDLSFNCGLFMNTGIKEIQFYPIKILTRKIK